MRKKIVVFATNYFPFVGGVEIAVQEVSRRLCDTYDFFIITSRQKRELPTKETVPEGTIIRVGFGNRFDKWLLPFFGVIALCRLGFTGDVPKPWQRGSRSKLLIWGMDISQGSLGAYVTKILFCKIPFVFTIQYGYGDMRLRKGRMGAINFAFRRMLKTADSVTAISSYLFHMAEIRGFAGMGKIIPNGVDTSVFAFYGTRNNEKNREQGQRMVITTSRLVHKNGIDILIRAIAEVKEKYPSIKCYILGDGTERGSLEKLAKELKLERDIIFLGNIPYEELPFYLGKADVFARPSRFEGMGNSFVEALAAGVPTIGTPVGGIPDIIIDRKTGLMCNVDDPHDLSQKILLLFEDQSLANRVRMNGRRLIEEKFSWSTIARSYGDMFEKLLNIRKRVLIATPLYPPEIGGPATYAYILAQHLADKEIGVRVIRFGEVRTLPKIMRHAVYFFKILMRARGYDYIFALDPVSVGFPAVCAVFTLRKTFILKIVGDYAWEQGVQRFGVTELLDDFLKKFYGRRIEWLRNIQYFTARRARGIIVPSEYLKRVVTAWGIDASKIKVIANAESVETISESREILRNILSLSGTVLLSAGRLVPWKGFKLLIELMSELVQHHSDVTLLIAGSGPQKEELELLIAVKGLNDHVKLLGTIAHANLLKYMKASDAFVLATAYEGLSHTILETMAMGTLVIASNAGGNPELIEHGKNGFLFNVNDHKNIIQTIKEALALPENKKIAMSKAAVSRASCYMPERMAEETAHYFFNL